MISKSSYYSPTNALARTSHSQPSWILKSAFENHLYKRTQGTANTVGSIVGVLVAVVAVSSLIGAYFIRRWSRNKNVVDNELEMQKDEEMDKKALEAQNKQWEWRGSKLPTQEWRQSWSSQAPSDVDVDVGAGGEEFDHFGTSVHRRDSTLSGRRQQWRKSTLSNQINPEDLDSDAVSTRSRQRRKSTLSNHTNVEDLDDLDVPEMPQIPSKAWRASNISNFSLRSMALSENEERHGKTKEPREERWSCAILE
jgi:hypothetical protein